MDRNEFKKELYYYVTTTFWLLYLDSSVGQACTILIEIKKNNEKFKIKERKAKKKETLPMLIHYCYLLYSYMYRFFLYCSWLHKFHSMEDCNFYSRVIIHTWLYINIYLKKSTYNSVCAHAQNCREKNFFPIFIKSTIFYFAFYIFNQ